MTCAVCSVKFCWKMNFYIRSPQIMPALPKTSILTRFCYCAPISVKCRQRLKRSPKPMKLPKTQLCRAQSRTGTEDPVYLICISSWVILVAEAWTFKGPHNLLGRLWLTVQISNAWGKKNLPALEEYSVISQQSIINPGSTRLKQHKNHSS